MKLGHFVQGGFCTGRLLYREAFVQGGFCTGRLLYREAFVQKAAKNGEG
jgi:hypothetical protein